MPEARGQVSGTNTTHRVAFYGLSTCIWCKKTLKLLKELDVAFDYAYVDLLHGQEREEVLEMVRRWNEAASFPTVIIDDAQCVVGYKPDRLKETLKP